MLISNKQYNVTNLVLRDESGVRGVRISLGSEFDLKELLLDIVELPCNLDIFEAPIKIHLKIIT